MVSPPPSSDVKAAVVGYPATHPPRSGRQAPDLPRGTQQPLPHAPRSPPQPPCICARRKSALWWMVVILTAVAAFFIVLVILGISISDFAGPGYPKLNVAGLTVSNITVNASSGAAWKASLLMQKPGYFGSLFFQEVECFVYYNWDAAQPWALALAEPFVLRSNDRTVVKAKIIMDRRADAMVEDMRRELRSAGTVVVGLGVRMQGTYILASWWKKSCRRIEAYCDNLRVAFKNRTGEGSLVTSNKLPSGDNVPSDSLPSCTYKGVDYGATGYNKPYFLCP